ncbi:hypothetical protein VTN00DRAFT_7278 [Thermoascus crustaceus]|uniref:uncharacterized protein n=1 Tax=Thermoascus crustaceus TaxID=5088 RepID=UPI003743DD4A
MNRENRNTVNGLKKMQIGRNAKLAPNHAERTVQTTRERAKMYRLIKVRGGCRFDGGIWIWKLCMADMNMDDRHHMKIGIK